MSIGPLIVVAASALVATAAGSHGEVVVVGVSISLQTDIPGSLLIRARNEASTMYSEAGVRFVWRDRLPDPGESDAAIELLVIIVGRPMPERPSPPGEMGVASGTPAERGRIAHIFFDRVSAAADIHRTGVEKMLGLAIAHELGHLLLPDGRHSDDGVMRAEWTRGDFDALKRGRLRMTAAEGRLIHARFGR
jgi:hypothetical protein